MLVFIGRSDRLASSDVRAQLAEGLENILPRMNDDGTWATTKRYLELVTHSNQHYY